MLALVLLGCPAEGPQSAPQKPAALQCPTCPEVKHQVFVYFNEDANPLVVAGVMGAFLPKDPIILEGGAFKGEHAVALSKLWPEGQLHAFEPVPSLFEESKKALKPFPNAKVYDLALSDQVGTATFHVSQYDEKTVGASSSLLAPKEHTKEFPSVAFKKEIKVPTITIDKWAKDNGIDHVDFLYLDIQGAELAAMKGAPEIMKTVKVVLTEVCFTELYDSVPSYEQIKEWLESQGFRMIGGNFNPAAPKQSALNRGQSSGESTFGDAIFVRESVIEESKARAKKRATPAPE